MVTSYPVSKNSANLQFFVGAMAVSITSYGRVWRKYAGKRGLESAFYTHSLCSFRASHRVVESNLNLTLALNLI